MATGEQEPIEPVAKEDELERATRDSWIRKGERTARWIIIGCGLLYGGITRVVFGIEPLSKWLGGAASATFLFLVPLAMGSLVAFLGMTLGQPKRAGYWGAGAPLLCLLIGMLVSLVTGFEAAFCLVVAAPILILMTLLGGLITALIVRRTGGGRLQVTAVVLLPYAVAPLEQLIALPKEILTVHNQIGIHASRAEVWSQIASVPEISRDELSWSWVHTIGFPRPLAAVLDGEGVGAARIATFERNVSFFERITDWQPGSTIAFGIEADPQFVPANAFDQHVIVGGRFYDVLDGRYVIEDAGDGKVMLHLSSRHRLNTHLGRYASWWSEQVMDEIQGNILEVIRKRAENQTGK
jgi:hypothetical protein